MNSWAVKSLISGFSCPDKDAFGATIPAGVLCVYKAVFILVGFAASVFRGCYAVTILVTGGLNDTWLSEKRKKLPEVPDGKLEAKLPDKWHFHHHWSWWVHEIFINFAGSLIGWAAAYYIIFCHKKVDTLADIFLVLVAMAGIFGFLPFLLFKSSLK